MRIFAARLTLFPMIELIKTIAKGIKEGTIAAWYDLKDYFYMMAIILVIYIAFVAILRLIKMMKKGK